MTLLRTCEEISPACESFAPAHDTSQGHDGRRTKASAGLIIALCIAVAVVSRMSFLAQPFSGDSGIYIYMGKVLAEGGSLYRDFFETKFPSVALLTAPLYLAFG